MTFKPLTSLGLVRSLVVLVGLSLAYVGFEELRLRIRCWSPRDLSLAEAVAATASGPVWATVPVQVPRLDVVSVTTQTGNSQGAWIPLPGDAGAKVPAVLVAESSSDLTDLRSRNETVTVQVLAHTATGRERKALGAGLQQLGLDAARDLVVLELDRRPASLLAGLFWLALGIGLAAASALGVSVPLPRLPMWIWQEPAATLTEEPHVLPPLEAGPLPEEVKVEVHHMLDDVWSGVTSRR